jgi:hypothetical protein
MSGTNTLRGVLGGWAYYSKRKLRKTDFVSLCEASLQQAREDGQTILK